MQSLLTPRLPLQLAMAVPLLLPLPVGKPGTGLGLQLAVAVPFLLPLSVDQPGTGLDMVLAVAVPLLLPLSVGQSGTGLGLLLAVAVLLLLPFPVGQRGTGLRLLLAVAGPLLFPARVGQPTKLMHFDIMCLHTNLQLHRILYKLHNNFRCYKFILHDKFLILGSWTYFGVPFEPFLLFFTTAKVLL